MMLIIITLFGCGQVEAPPATEQPIVAAPAAGEVPADIRKAVDIAKAIEKEPTRVDGILADNGTTREAYEALLYEISLDPARAAAYAGALEAR